MLHARVKRAGVPHAISAAYRCLRRRRACPGVVSRADRCRMCPARHSHGLVIYDWPVMVGVGERVRYVGDALAIVAAESA